MLHTTPNTANRQEPQGVVADLLMDLHGPVWHKPWTTIMRAFLDESGTHGGSPLAVLAGYNMLPEEWKHFAVEWDQMLQSFGVPRIHMSEFFHHEGDYFSMPEFDKRRLFEAASSIIARRSFGGIIAAVNTVQWHAIIDPLADQGFDLSPYGMCFLGAASLNAMWASRLNYPDRIAYVIHRGNVDAHDVTMADLSMNLIQKAGIDFHYGRVTFADDEDVNAVQAGDFISYVFRQEQFGVVPPSLAGIWDKLVWQKPHFGGVISPELYRVYAEWFPMLREEMDGRREEFSTANKRDKARMFGEILFSGINRLTQHRGARIEADASQQTAD